MTFASADGRLCRTFDSGRASGLACRDDGRLAAGDDRVRPPGRRSAPIARPAADPLVLQAAQELMAGEPLDDAAERRARDSGWRRSEASR